MEHVLSNDGTRIGYEKAGTGPPLIFVHGMAADRASWARIAPRFADRFTVYAVDRRGRGDSQVDAAADAPYDLHREAEDAAAVVARAAEETGAPAALFGHSFGGLVCLEAALLAERLDRLILYEPHIPASTLAYSPAAYEQLQQLVQRGAHETAMVTFLREIAQLDESDLAAYRRMPIWPQRIGLAPSVLRELSVDQSYRFQPERFAGLRVPTLLMLGGESSEAERTAVETVRAALPDCRVALLPGQQHIAHLTNPELFAEVLRQFLLG